MNAANKQTDQTAGQTSAAMIEVENLSRAFGSLKAVDEVSFSIGHKEIFGFLGPNGAGKTTTINMVGLTGRADDRVETFSGG